MSEGFAKAVPDYDKKCMVCGNTPCVTILDKKDKIVANIEMCGVGAWGQASCIDPNNW